MNTDNLLSVSIDEEAVRAMLKSKISEMLQTVDAEMVFWDANELKRRTCMSWNFIQEQFFFDPEFPKFKVGSKWYFPAKKTRAFLEQWLVRQGG